MRLILFSELLQRSLEKFDKNLKRSWNDEKVESLYLFDANVTAMGLWIDEKSDAG